jgi:hypothetical protein
MEIPTTSNIKALESFHQVFLEHIRPVADHENHSLDPELAEEHDSLRSKFIPSSIVMDVVSYLKYHLSEFAADEVLKMGQDDDTEKMVKRCDELDPYFKATRALALAINVFAIDAAETFTTDQEED